MTSKLESWRRAAYNAEECLAGCLASPEIAKHLDQGTARTILERLSQARLEMLAASEATQPAAIKLPERKKYNGLGSTAENLTSAAWNECLDAVQKLNAVRGAEHE
ncbi:hypothetical protein [Pseudomonas sp. LA5]|uniref:hypothetical protein n=1 Tax=Pseudomonas sp. LA5 TaxID=3027850 RepID=UPI0023619C6F|nr:hypothetical protein [Pseudomonas sp. LA5]